MVCDRFCVCHTFRPHFLPWEFQQTSESGQSWQALQNSQNDKNGTHAQDCKGEKQTSEVLE